MSFNGSQTLVEGKEYGDFANGTGRVVRSPHTLHIWEPYSNGIVKEFLRVARRLIPVTRDQIHLAPELPYWLKKMGSPEPVC